MTILHAVGRLDIGGVESYLLDFVPEAQKRGVQSHFVTLFERETGSLAPRFEAMGCRIYPSHALRARGAMKATVRRAAEETKADVLLSHLGEMSGDPLAVLNGRIHKIAVHAHDLGGLAQPWMSPYRAVSRRRVSALADTILAVSPEAGRRLTSRPFTVVPVGLNLEDWKPDPEGKDRIRSELGGKPLLLHVGRFVGVKNQGFLIALALLLQRQRNIDFTLAFAGDGPDIALVQSKAAGNPAIRFLGRRNDIRALMSAADVLLLPSLSEGTPRVLLEAAAIGLPFIATANADLDGLFPPDCRLPIDGVGRWADRITEVLRNPQPVKPLLDIGIARAVDQTLAALA